MKSQIFNFISSNNTRRSIYLGLTFAHLITTIYWIKDNGWLRYSTENYKIFCYPMFKNCYQFIFEDTLVMKLVFISYFLLTIFSFLIIGLNKKNLFLPLLILLTLIKTTILFSRYNFMGNYHTMHLSLCIITIISTASINYYRLTLVLQYFFAGLLKLNKEWITGASLVSYSPYMFQNTWYLMSLAYVPVLELVLVWGLLSKSKTLRLVTLSQLVFFHLYSVFIVGFYYPLIMTGLLIPILYFEFSNFKIDNFKNVKESRTIQNTSSLIFILIMFYWNISSKFYNIDPAMDGTVRYLTLNMLDAKLKCQHTLLEETQDGTVVALNIPKLATYLRIHCDAMIFETFLKRLCNKNPERKFMFYLESTRTTDKQFTLVREYKNVCQEL